MERKFIDKCYFFTLVPGGFPLENRLDSGYWAVFENLQFLCNFNKTFNKPKQVRISTVFIMYKLSREAVHS